MKRFGKIVLACLFLMLGVGITVAVLLTKDKETPEDAGGKSTDNITQPAEVQPITEGNGGRLVLSELALSVIEPKDVTVEYLQEIVRLANEIYEKNDTVVLSDQTIAANRKYNDLTKSEVTYEEYYQYIQDLYSIVRELIRLSFSEELLCITSADFEPNSSATVPFDGEYLVFDIAESGCKDASEWLHKLFFSTSGFYPDMGRHLRCSENMEIYYVTDMLRYTRIFPSEQQSKILSSLSAQSSK